MKVLIIHKLPPFLAGGAEQVVWRTANRFAERGHSVVFLCPTPSADETVPDVPNIDFNWIDTSNDQTHSQFEFFIRGSWVYKSIFRTLNPDLVYDNICPFPFHMAHIYGDTPVISKVHAIYRSDAFNCKHHLLSQVGTYLGEYTYRMFRDEMFITNSHSTKERLEDLLVTDRNKVIANPIGIDNTEFSFNVPDTAELVLSLAKLSPRKDMKTLLKAWARAENEFQNTKLVIAGSGPMESELHSTAKRLNLDRVQFLGYVPERKKVSLYEESSIYILPTLYEGFGLSNLEAMASGCAVLTTNTWGVKDYMQHGKNGYVVDKQSPNQLFHALKLLMSNNKKRIRLAKNGRRTAMSYQIDDSVARDINIAEEYIN